MSSSHNAFAVKSWVGLGFGALVVLVTLAAWLESGDWTRLLAAAGFACWAIVWSQMPLSYTASLKKVFSDLPRLGRGYSALSLLGFALVALAVALRWLR